MKISTAKERAGLASWILLAGFLATGCLAEPDVELLSIQELSTTADLEPQADVSEVASIDEVQLADGTAATDAIEIAGTAPTCVFLSVDSGIVTKTVRLTNNCGFTVRVRVDVSFNPDLSCVSLNPGQGASWKVPRTWLITGVNNC